MKTNEDNKTIIESHIISLFFFLEEMGYKVHIVNPNDSTVITSFDVIYQSIERKREISISYTHRLLNNEHIFGFHAAILSLPYKDGTEDFLSLSVYLKSIGKDFTFKFSNHFDEEKAIVMLTKIANALKEFCNEIITGETWIKGYYPRWS